LFGGQPTLDKPVAATSAEDHAEGVVSVYGLVLAAVMFGHVLTVALDTPLTAAAANAAVRGRNG
jgi:hypothetical protein